MADVISFLEKRRDLELDNREVSFIDSPEAQDAEKAVSLYNAAIEALTSISKRPKRPRLALVPADIKGLPPELIKELSIGSDDEDGLLEFQVLEFLEENGGIANLDQIIIGLYRRTGEIHKRTALSAKLFRMSKKELVRSVPKKKGVYASFDFDEPITD